ncbi:mitochondrial import receptor subunit TOM40 homolog 1-like [Ctenocephalides felis]|uniref:mitochondrial import receptor subunit TOM40 homolog 1-like n=1 Tax=Ctenocephalides felis TaxID=7515 RepID=UPI000E6E2FBD|nr:mitochondrial import receptor subunit TOM40 homolog 1-like [Ctenocephalides felis]
MGSVLAKSEKLKDPLFDDIGNGFVDNEFINNGQHLQQAESKPPDNNPGTFEELHKLCKDVMPVTFEGGKIILNKMLSNNFQISHTVNLGANTGASGYRFGSTYVGLKQFSPTESFPVLFGDIDPQGNLNANIVHQLTDRIRCKISTLIQNSKVAGAQVSADYRKETYTLSCTVCNPNIINSSGMFLAHYLQNIYPGLAMGAEFAYQCSRQIPGGEAAAFAGAARIENGIVSLSGTFGQTGLHLCFYRKASEQLQISAEFETNFKSQEAVGTIGYQVDLPAADLVFRGSIDTNWNASAVFETKIRPLPVNFALSGLLNHQKSQFRLGCGVVIG